MICFVKSAQLAAILLVLEFICGGRRTDTQISKIAKSMLRLVTSLSVGYAPVLLYQLQFTVGF